MNYHKMASFWILLSCLIFTGVNPTLHNSIGLLFPFFLFSLELYFIHISKLRETDLKNRNSTVDSELAELKLELEKENVRASVENVRRHRSLQDQTNSGGKSVDKKEWVW